MDSSTWPLEYGEAASSGPSKSAAEEMARITARLPLSMGTSMIGPAILEFGSDVLKKHLPQIARGEIRWCQGYSEPGSGSDLAGLQTRAESW